MYSASEWIFPDLWRYINVLLLLIIIIIYFLTYTIKRPATAAKLLLTHLIYIYTRLQNKITYITETNTIHENNSS